MAPSARSGPSRPSTKLVSCSLTYIDHMPGKGKQSRGSDAKLARLHALRHESASAEIILELRRYLADKSSLIVAEAAKILRDQTASALAGDLVAAFDRLMIEPEESDKHCRAKIEIVAALNRLEYREPEVFLRGLSHH